VKKLEMLDSDHSLGWVDFSAIIAGKTTFTLTYNLKDDKWNASIKDGYNELLCREFDVCDETAFGLIDSDEYMQLKEINSDLNNAKKKPVDELKQAFWNVLKLAKGGQQPWWTDKLKQDSDEAIDIIEQYYNEKYSK